MSWSHHCPPSLALNSYTSCHLLLPHSPSNTYAAFFPTADPLTRRKRKQHGGNSGKNFTEGWVEFEDKADAKRVVAMLNGQPMGGKRRSSHYYDLWCLKYLPKFKWDHLTEEINYQKAVKEQRLAAEVSAAKRERDFYLSRVDKAKAVDAILERKKRKKGGDDGAGEGDAPEQGVDGDKGSGSSGGGKEQAEGEGVRVLRAYGQRKAKADPVNDEDAPMLSRSVLEMIAGRKKQKKATDA